MIESITRDEWSFPISEADYDINLYWRAMFNGEPYFYVHAQIACELAVIHAYALNFGSGRLRAAKADFTEIKKNLANRGIKVIMGLKETDCVKWEKFVRLMGFLPSVEITLDGRSVRRVLMEVDCGS